MKPRNEIVEMLTAAFGNSRSRFDIRVVVEEIADELVLINDEHCRQLAMLKAEFDANIAAMRRELASVKMAFDDLKEINDVTDNVVQLRQ
jgi:hypothetical protein